MMVYFMVSCYGILMKDRPNKLHYSKQACNKVLQLSFRKETKYTLVPASIICPSLFNIYKKIILQHNKTLQYFRNNKQMKVITLMQLNTASDILQIAETRIMIYNLINILYLKYYLANLILTTDKFVTKVLTVPSMKSYPQDSNAL